MRNLISPFLTAVKSKLDAQSDFAHGLFFKKLFCAFLLFLLFYLCIYAVFHAKKEAETKIQQLIVLLEKNNIYIDNPQIKLLFPEIKFDALSHRMFPDFTIEDGRINLSLWNKEIDITGKLAEGTINAKIKLDALFSPTAANITSLLEHIDLKNFSRAFPMQTILQVNEGIADMNIALDLPLQNFMPQLSGMKGTIKSSINNASLTNYIPIINKSAISDLKFVLDLQIDKTNMPYCNISLHSDILSAEITGSAALNYTNFMQSNLNLNTIVKIDKNNINQELTPQNTLNSILKKNEVRMKITGPIKSVKVNVL